MGSFEITTVSIVLVILGLFAFGAYKAEQAVAAKAKLQREAHAGVKTSKPLKKKL